MSNEDGSGDDPDEANAPGDGSPLTALGWLRAMTAGTESGGSEPHLFETDEGPFMVKVRNNPQGERVPVNELVAGSCLQWLGVARPRVAVVNVPADVLKDSSGARFSNGTKLTSGDAFGSEYVQSDPAGTVDVGLICNPGDVAATAVLDTWIKNNDGRQYRVAACANHPKKYEFIPLDHGHCFGSPDWTDATLDADRTVVQVDPVAPVSWSDVEPIVERLEQFNDAAAETIVASIPADWITADERASLKAYLVERATLASDAAKARFNPVGGP